MNYHLFIVDEISLKYHLEYCFVGTGKLDTNFDIELWKDIVRLKSGDKIVFYVQSLKKFYGFFEVKSRPFFDSKHYLQPNPLPFLGNNQIRLQYRAFIKPYKVFRDGIDEFELIDILPQSSKDVLWSILYRKLKGARGCSPLFENEFNIIFQKIACINNNQLIDSNKLTFSNNRIQATDQKFTYTQGFKKENIPIIKKNILSKNYRESHLHALLIEFLNKQPYTNWLGNEVYSGAGMQAMDILTIDNNNVVNIFEIKKDEVPSGITNQISKYIQWLQYRFQCFNSNAYQPILISKTITGQRKLLNRINEFIKFNNLQVSLPIIYIVYEINIQNNTIDFYEHNYTQNRRNLTWSI